MQRDTQDSSCTPEPKRWHLPAFNRRLENWLQPQHDFILVVLLNLASSLTYFFIAPVILWFYDWVPVAITGIVEIFLISFLMTRKIIWNQWLGFLLTVVQFAFVASTIWNLVQKLPQHPEELHGINLLQSGAMLWISNLLVFTIWYWRFDGGGPHLRDPECPHISFVFPQLMLSKRERLALEQENWKPGVIDYLFLAFNTSTALSPADTAVVGRGAKLTTMLQSLVSLSIVVIVIGRGVNVI